ncbi:hypothetical protein LEP1GSC043_0580 [Leptospira weilii str. Ecochallenge]|uniref:Uncharacterized protein n=1 Tax=Leptospira weilii str. Ecochallenge TaxID=1049986 RepID=N1UBW0_9LEPT|nr:hypothetical protein LEP1GSC043_0580 [Leptospira weilii str. Ecochallenge]
MKPIRDPLFLAGFWKILIHVLEDFSFKIQFKTETSDFKPF